MKKRIILTQTLIFAIGLTTYSCTGNMQEAQTSSMELITVTNGVKSSSLEHSTPQKKVPPIFYFRPDYYYSVSKKEIQDLKTLGDFIPDYPSSWISNYTSVEIIFKYNGEEKTLKSKNDILNQVQINAFKTAELGTEINVLVHYKTENSVTNVIDSRTLTREAKVIPSQEAKIIGDEKKLTKALYKKVENLFPDFEIDKTMIIAKIGFVINKTGKAEKINIIKSSGDKKTDEIMINIVKEMKAWIPAKNLKGDNVPQNFEFVLGLGC